MKEINPTDHRIHQSYRAKSGYLELIIGPMFSGKSTELIRQIRLLQKIDKKVLVLKPIIGGNKTVNGNSINSNTLG